VASRATSPATAPIVAAVSVSIAASQVISLRTAPSGGA